MNTKIRLSEMRFHAFHGVLPHEREVGTEFVVNLLLDVDVSQAIESDRVEDTVNYAHLYELVKEEMSIPSHLIEHVAGRIGKSIKQRYPQVSALEIRVAKMLPPVNGLMEKAEIVLNM